MRPPAAPGKPTALPFQEASQHMKELIRSNDLVLLSYVEALLKEADIDHELADEHMSAVLVSNESFPRRILVSDEDWSRAKELVDAAQSDQVVSDDG
jgi:hypothetical protein